MALSHEEAAKIKEHLLNKLKNFPQEKRQEIQEKVEAMPLEEVEEFIKENKLTHLGNQCIFCSIVAGKMPSYKIFEDAHHIAVLEINPLSKGHSLVIPKHHEHDISQEKTKNFAKEVATMLAEKLSPNEVKIAALKIMDHPLLEVIPLFGEEKERWQASPNELLELQEFLTKPLEKVKIEPKKEEPKELSLPLYRLPSRIP